jgi:serine transporter
LEQGVEVTNVAGTKGGKWASAAGMTLAEWRAAIKFNWTDFGWVIMCIGMAIGAGIVFLPVQVGRVGLWIYLCSGLIGYPALWLSQRLYINTLVASEKCENYPSIITGYLGRNMGLILGLLYFLMLIKAIFGYSIASTNDSASFLHSFGITQTVWSSNPFYGLAVICILVALASRGEKALFKISTGMVLTKLCVIVCLGFVMIPHWNFANVTSFPEINYLIKQTIIMMPFTITSLLFSQCLSPLVISYRTHNENKIVAKYKAVRAMNIAYAILFVAIFFYAISFNLTMSQEQAIAAYHQNISALAMVAQGVLGNTVRIFSFILNIFAIMTAFFGAFLGFREALQGLAMNILRRFMPEEKINMTYVKYGIFSFAILIPWIVVLINFSLVRFFIIFGPMYGLVNCLIPLYLVYRVPQLAELKSRSLILVFVAGVMLCLAPVLEFLL